MGCGLDGVGNMSLQGLKKWEGIVKEDGNSVGSVLSEETLQVLTQELDGEGKGRVLDEARKIFEAERPARMVILGPANSGKSSFINLLFGKTVSEVRAVASTTKGVIEEKHAMGVTLVDSPGFGAEDADDQVAAKAAENADLLLVFFDVTRLDREQLALWKRYRDSGCPAIPIFNKADLLSVHDLAAVQNETLPRWSIEQPLFLSVTTGYNLSTVLKAIADKLPLECRAHFLGWLSDELHAATVLRQQIEDEAKRKLAEARTAEERRKAEAWREYELSQVPERARTIDSSAMEARDAEADRVIMNHSLAAAGLGTIPLPVVDIPLVASVQIRMLIQIAGIYGQRGGWAYMKAVFAPIIIRVGGRALLSSLLKIIPVIGTILGGVIDAAASFALTYGLGQTGKAHFRDNLEPEAFTDYAKKAAEEGRERFHEARD